MKIVPYHRAYGIYFHLIICIVSFHTIGKCIRRISVVSCVTSTPANDNRRPAPFEYESCEGRIMETKFPSSYRHRILELESLFQTEIQCSGCREAACVTILHRRRECKLEIHEHVFQIVINSRHWFPSSSFIFQLISFKLLLMASATQYSN